MSGTSDMSRRPAGPPRGGVRLTALALLLAVFGAQQAQAGMFDDEEARRQITDLKTKVNERIDTTARAQIELANQIQALRDENARLRGQVETLAYELESAKKRQQDFYVDLDARLRKFETQAVADAKAASEASGTSDPAAPAEKPAVKAPAADPAAESREYETALNFFKANKLKEAAGAFEAFAKNHPGSPQAASAQYWLGNAHYALRDCKKAVEAQKTLLAKWPDSPKAPDAMINIASCQQELGDAKAAKSTLETILIKYPDSPAAGTAKQRLKKK